VSVQGHIATARFGLGAVPGELETVARDPRAWLLAQLARVPALPDGLDDAIPTAARALEITIEQQRTQPDPNPVAQSFRESNARLVEHWQATQAPFFERLALFWTNHFCVSIRGGNTGAMLADYHLRAIRPRILGPFKDLLLASARHPAMLRYLDNHLSIGPNSEAAERQRARREQHAQAEGQGQMGQGMMVAGRGGLNENLAREILELHTLSPARFPDGGGYTQADVTSFAKIITGWSAGNPGPAPFLFRPQTHEPGEKTLLGRTFPEGEAGGLAALDFLGTHPATYRFIATKLVRHFVADDPPAAAVSRIEGVLKSSGGDLGAASRALVALPEAWARPLAKLRTPADFVLAAMRATQAPVPPPARVGAFSTLGQPLFAAPAPNGWPDTASAWTAPEALLRRIEWATQVAARMPAPPDPRALLDATLGEAADAPLRDAVRGAPSVRDGVMLVLASPAFQRR
jgi:uncharacterized protein (DUF1800 family)